MFCRMKYMQSSPTINWITRWMWSTGPFNSFRPHPWQPRLLLEMRTSTDEAENEIGFGRLLTGLELPSSSQQRLDMQYPRKSVWIKISVHLSGPVQPALCAHFSFVALSFSLSIWWWWWLNKGLGWADALPSRHWLVWAAGKGSNTEWLGPLRFWRTHVHVDAM